MTAVVVPSDGRSMPQVDGVRHRFVAVRGVRLHLAEAGPSEAPPVLLLHGFPQHWYAWHGLLVDLADKYRVIAVDLPGSAGAARRHAATRLLSAVDS